MRSLSRIQEHALIPILYPTLEDLCIISITRTTLLVLMVNQPTAFPKLTRSQRFISLLMAVMHI